MNIASFSPVPAPVLAQWLISQSGLTALNVLGVDEMAGASWDQALSTAEVALGDYTFRHPINQALLERMPRLRFVQQPSVGYQHIDLDACQRRGVVVANTPGVNSAAVAEHTIMCALVLLRRLIVGNELTHAGRWSQHELMWEKGIFELSGKTFGIVGLGSVGREVAKRLIPFGVSLCYYDLHRAPPEVEQELTISYKPLDHLLRLADVVSLHVPLTDQTHHLIGARELSLMKYNALLLNLARGECVDEHALADRLKKKAIGGVACDVFSQEPIAADHPLLGVENALLTPHVAGATNEVRERVVHMAVANLARVIRGQPPEHALIPANK